MTFLSRVPQHELRIRAGRMPDGPNTRHRDVMSIFGEFGDNARTAAGVLFRLEHLPGQAASYLIRSKVMPARMTPGGQTVVETDSSIPETGATVAFRVAVNAVQRTKHGTRPVYSDGALQDLLEAGEILAEEAERAVEITPWLSTRLAPGLVDIHVINHQREVIGRDRRGRPKSGEDMAVQVDLVDGVALVNDTGMLRTILKEGVGRAKSYGCGLLTIRAI